MTGSEPSVRGSKHTNPPPCPRTLLEMPIPLAYSIARGQYNTEWGRIRWCRRWTIAAQRRRMLDSHTFVHATKTQHAPGIFQRHIAASDEEIDRWPYALYGLSEEEIAIVEEHA